ncbi:MAG: efflux RND transporter periplasmic adaptor subunit [Deltaproteobacteria bacterium]|nr:efflux RND transporter periplasmic adaptor subunit [Deltaproteobacteria bacterium]MCW5801855.1 efflux RND transporter periplasmic adaptor subunit [Deltaproteobacteria bacterium]
MKRILTYLVALIIAGAIIAAFAFLYVTSQKKDVIYETETPENGDVTKKTVATGSIIPRQEVEVKPKVSGVLAELYVDAGKIVKKGDPLGKIAIIPDAMATNQAEAAVRTAQIAFENAKRELARNEDLFAKGVIADAELQKFRVEFRLRQQELATAGSNLQLVKEGQTANQGKASTLIVTATVDGMVIDVPVKVGFSVIQANNFNAGTTIAVIANMDDMIFQGRVDEAEVAKIKEGMKLAIKVGALDKDMLDGTLEFIAPKGKEIDGAIQFEIKAAVKKKDNVTIRANYSANADIVLEEVKNKLTIREALVQYKDDKPFVEIEGAPQMFTKKDVRLGLSDGIKVEVLEGVAPTDRIKIPDNAGPAMMGGGPGGPGGPGGKGPGRPPGARK